MSQPPNSAPRNLKSLPLHWEPVSGHPVPEKLAAMLAALKSGSDPNELDHAPRAERSIGRPLHYATEYTFFDHSLRHENLPVVELLLKHGADPRLPGMEPNPSPLEDLRAVVNANTPEVKWASERDMEFFKRALNAMEEKARELDGKFCFNGGWGKNEWDWHMYIYRNWGEEIVSLAKDDMVCIVVKLRILSYRTSWVTKSGRFLGGLSWRWFGEHQDMMYDYERESIAEDS